VRICLAHSAGNHSGYCSKSFQSRRRLKDSVGNVFIRNGESKSDEGLSLHETFKRRAIALAAHNPSAPFAALLVSIETGKILAEGVYRNTENPTWHGEIDAINRCAEARLDVNWGGSRLYTTAEPSCMCQGAILWAGIPEVVYGTAIRTLKRLGWNQIGITAEKVTRRTPFANCRLTGGVLDVEFDQLFQRAMGIREDVS
jgi:tRNA(adenine34) deaminase